MRKHKTGWPLVGMSYIAHIMPIKRQFCSKEGNKNWMGINNQHKLKL